MGGRDLQNPRNNLTHEVVDPNISDWVMERSSPISWAALTDYETTNLHQVCCLWALPAPFDSEVDFEINEHHTRSAGG